MSRLIICLALFVAVFFSASSYSAEPSSNIILNRAFVAAMNASKKGGVDFNIYEKIVNNKLHDYFESIQIEEISVQKYKFLIFREKSKSGALFIANGDGKIIFHQHEWGINHNVVYPYENNSNYFAVTRKEPMDNPGEHNEYIYVFEASQKEAKKVLTYLNSTEYCIMNPLLPKEVRESISGQYYTACRGNAVVKKFTPHEVEVQYTYKLDKDFLTDDQYNKVLKQYSFAKTGESIFNWTFKRPKGKDSFVLARGRTIHPITGENTSLSTKEFQ